MTARIDHARDRASPGDGRGSSAKPAIRRRRPFGRPVPLHVLLLPAVPALVLWSGNAAQLRSMYPARIAIGCALVAVTLTGIVTVVQRDLRRSGMIGSVSVTLALTSGLILTQPTRASLNLTVLGAAVGAVIFVAIRSTEFAIRTMTLMLNAVAIAVVAANVSLIALNRPSTFAVSEDVPTGTVPGRDVWYLVPDRLPSQATLESLGIEVDGFFDGLRDRGFDVAEQAWANYPQTSLSLASAWSLDYLSGSTEQGDFSEPLTLLDDPRIGQAFDAAGYHYTHLGSWPAFSATSQSADTVLTLQGAGEFWTAWEATTILPTLRFLLDVGTPGTVAYNRQVEHASYQLDRLELLASAEPAEPEFVLAHLVLPHGPYIFEEDGSLRPRENDVTSRAGYAAQLNYFGERLHTIIDLLQQRDDSPVIVLMADEGLYEWDLDGSLEQEDDDPSAYSATQLQRKMSILAAVHDPDDQIDDLSPGTSAVNVTRSVVSGVLSLELPPLPDRSYRWADKSQTRLLEIPEGLLAPADSS